MYTSVQSNKRCILFNQNIIINQNSELLKLRSTDYSYISTYIFYNNEP